MPLVLLVGHPCSGKTTRANELAAHICRHLGLPEPCAAGLAPSTTAPAEAVVTSATPSTSAPSETPPPDSTTPATTATPSPPAPGTSLPPTTPSPIRAVHVVNHASIHFSVRAMYASNTSEKQGRSLFRSHIERLLNANTLVIVDYINNIKGYRYELFCRAKEAATTYAVVHVDTPIEQCRAWNEQRSADADDWYSERIFADLTQRMETPNNSKRWDSPLFVVKPEDAMPLADLTQLLLYGKTMTPGAATVPAKLESADYLFELDRLTAATMQAVLNVQSLPGFSLHTPYPLPLSPSVLGASGASSSSSGGKGKSTASAPASFQLTFPRPMHLAELRRVQQQYLRVARLRPPQGTSAAIVASFVAHVQSALEV